MRSNREPASRRVGVSRTAESIGYGPYRGGSYNTPSVRYMSPYSTQVSVYNCLLSWLSLSLLLSPLTLYITRCCCCCCCCCCCMHFDISLVRVLGLYSCLLSTLLSPLSPFVALFFSLLSLSNLLQQQQQQLLLLLLLLRHLVVVDINFNIFVSLSKHYEDVFLYLFI